MYATNEDEFEVLGFPGLFAGIVTLYVEPLVPDTGLRQAWVVQLPQRKRRVFQNEPAQAD